MNKKIIGAVLCICILTIGSTPVIGIELKSVPEIKQELPFIDEVTQILEDNVTFGDNFLLTGGPVSKLFSKVELINGSEKQIKKIESYLEKKLFRFPTIIPFRVVFVENLTFTVEYPRDILRTRSRFSYTTINSTVTYDENGYAENITNESSIRNVAHKVTVEDFTGFFIFGRARFFKLFAPIGTKFFQPAKFLFYGFCEKLTIEQI